MFSTSKVCKFFNIERERLRDWMNRGYVIATWPSKKQGNASCFSRVDVIMVVIFKYLLQIGYKREMA